MRPVDRGAVPVDATTYEEMGPRLQERIGEYCSYCEYPVSSGGHTEHIVPKDQNPGWRNRWDNLLVACTWCNSCKGSRLPRPQDLGDYVWPDRDNTTRAFTYENIFPRVDPSIPASLQHKAARTLGLVKLGTSDDRRHRDRTEVYILALRCADRLRSASDESWAREVFVELALARGFFSVWMEVFAGDVSMRQRLIAAFVGTAPSCFDPATTQPIPRPGGQL